MENTMEVENTRNIWVEEQWCQTWQIQAWYKPLSILHDACLDKVGQPLQFCMCVCCNLLSICLRVWCSKINKNGTHSIRSGMWRQFPNPQQLRPVEMLTNQTVQTTPMLKSNFHFMTIQIRRGLRTWVGRTPKEMAGLYPYAKSQ